MAATSPRDDLFFHDIPGPVSRAPLGRGPQAWPLHAPLASPDKFLTRDRQTQCRNSAISVSYVVAATK